MKDALIVSVLSLVPRNRAARGMGWFARTGVSRAMKSLFVRVYGVDMSEAEHPPGHYSSLEGLFTRRLKPGARPIDAAPDAVVSPVDGKAAAVGTTVDGCIALPGGKQLDVARLLDEPVEGERDVAVLYLSPKDYHRVHVPREGTACRWVYQPGTLWPVFPAAVRRVDGLFSKNERLTVHIDTSFGPMAAVLVGAFGVGRISSPVADVITNLAGPRERIERACAHDLERGGELGVFHLGSTVVLVAPPGSLTWTVTAGDAVRMGKRLARQVAEMRGTSISSAC